VQQSAKTQMHAAYVQYTNTHARTHARTCTLENTLTHLEPTKVGSKKNAHHNTSHYSSAVRYRSSALPGFACRLVGSVAGSSIDVLCKEARPLRNLCCLRCDSGGGRLCTAHARQAALGKHGGVALRPRVTRPRTHKASARTLSFRRYEADIRARRARAQMCALDASAARRANDSSRTRSARSTRADSSALRAAARAAAACIFTASSTARRARCTTAAASTPKSRYEKPRVQ
jgi:hypothetical protein